MKELAAIIDSMPSGEIFKVKGRCREWCWMVSRQIDLIYQSSVGYEFREVQIEPEFWHTFLKIYLDDNIYIYDGVGVGKHDPFCGLEDDCPAHLKNNRVDRLMENARTGMVAEKSIFMVYNQT